jgi:hypothetical protein
MRNILLTFILINFFLFKQVFSQLVVEEGVTTDTINLFTKSNQFKKSEFLSIGASILLPGLGHQYLGDNKKAIIYYSTEALFIFLGITCNHQSKIIFNNAKAFAWEHAGIKAPSSYDDALWQNIGRYDESDGFNQDISRGYNKEMELIYRDQEKNYLLPELQWRWDDPENRKKYSAILQQSMSYQVASYFFIGAIVLNRLAAFIDTRLLYKKIESGFLSSIKFTPYYDYKIYAYGLNVSIYY